MITAVVIAKNEEKILEGCLATLGFCGEIIIIDNNSTDSTTKIAEKFTNKIFEIKTGSFSDIRDFGHSKATGDWLLYVDADERISGELIKEIIQKIIDPDFSAYAIPRKNVMFGKWVKYGGWYPDYQVRLFKNDKLLGWEGKLHERPKVTGEVGKLKNDIIHYTHRSISETLQKKLVWSNIEAEERLNANHPKITWPRIVRVMVSEFIKRYFIKSGWRDGTVGLITALDESFSMFVIYTRLWEMQNKR
jgi:glycosyltransferase involved in cell wall biosynthesis